MRKSVKSLIIIVVIATLFVGADYAFAASVSAPQGTSVPGCEETNKCFVPYEVTVDVGGTVTWSNDDSAAHTVTSGRSGDGPSGVFDSSLFMAGTTFSHTFEAEGEFPYFCMVHPWMNGIVKVGNYPYSPTASTETVITVQMDGPSTFYLDESNQIIRATVEIHNYTPSDGIYFMKVTHLPTQKLMKDSEIYPRNIGNDLWAAQIAYPFLESDITIGDQAFLGEFEIKIRTEKSSNTASTKFLILESSSEPESKLTSQSKIIIDAHINKSSFKEDEIINVAGNVNDILYGYTITLRVIAPNGNIISIEQISLDSDGAFSYDFVTNENLFAEIGEYTIQLVYGTDSIRKDILFSYIKSIPTPKPVPVPIPEPKVDPVPKVVESKPKDELLTPKVIEKTENVVEEQASPKQVEFEGYNALILLVVVIVVVIGGITAIKKRIQGKVEPILEDYDFNDYDKRWKRP